MKKTSLKNPTTVAIKMAVVAATAIVVSACGDLQDNTVAVEQVGYTADGSLVLFTPAGIAVYDGLLQNPLNFISVSGLGAPLTVSTLRYSLSADGTTAAVAYAPNPTQTSDAFGANTRVATYSIPDGKLLHLFDIPDAAPEPYAHSLVDLSLSPDGKLLFASTATDTLNARVLDTGSGAVLWTHGGNWTMPAWSADGATLFVAYTDSDSFMLWPNILGALDARTGELRWKTTLLDGSTPAKGISLGGLSLVGDGASLTGLALDTAQCPDYLPCSPVAPFWSAADGTLIGELPPQPGTRPLIIEPDWSIGFACDAKDTCAMRIIDSAQNLLVRVYKTDGTTLQTIPDLDSNANGTMAISPDGRFIAITPTVGFQGPVSVYSIADGTLAGSRAFPTQTF